MSADLRPHLQTALMIDVKKPALVYSTLIVVSIGVVLGLLRAGEALEHAPAIARVVHTSNGIQVAAHTSTLATGGLRNPLAVLMLQILVIMLATGACGAAAARLRQPRVIGEIAAGLLLGPSLLGFVMPVVSRTLFPPASLPMLQLLSQLGVMLFMFGVGLTVDGAQVRRRVRAAVAVSHASIVAPFCLAMLLSLALYPRYAADGVAFRSFALFMGVGMSITAFPVLARIMEEQGLSGTPIASMVITCAAVDDVTAWTLLALVVAFVTSGGAWASFAMRLALTLAFIVGMMRYARAPLARLLRADSGGSRDPAPIALVLVFAFALLTEAIGIHALFGAFVIGAVLPIARSERERLRDRLQSLTAVVLLPVFFALTGLRTDLHLLDDRTSWLMCAAIVAAATAGKVGACMLAARIAGLSWRTAFAIGSLMNSRGLMELVALNLGYELGIVPPEIFTMMVLMALATTAMTGPLLRLSGLAQMRSDSGKIPPARGRFGISGAAPEYGGARRDADPAV
jgi:Kef-type K+ transport system membrane component KefB